MKKVIAEVNVNIKIVEEDEAGFRSLVKKIQAFSAVREFDPEEVTPCFQQKHVQASLYQALADLSEAGHGSIQMRQSLASEAKILTPPQSATRFFELIRLEAIENLSDEEKDAFDIWWSDKVGDHKAWEEFAKNYPNAYSAILWAIDQGAG